jgi:hypothetical protein
VALAARIRHRQKENGVTTKRQQTMAKLTRERAVREKREKKLEKKRAAAAAKKDRANGIFPATVDAESSDLLLDPHETNGDETVAVDGESSDLLLDPHEANGDDGAVPGERVVAGL